MKRLTNVICIICLLLCSLPVYGNQAAANRPPENNSPRITDVIVKAVDDLKVSGVMPSVKINVISLGDSRFVAELNQKIKDTVDIKITEAIKNKAKSIEFSYKVAIDSGLTSILLYTKTTTSLVKEEIASFSYDNALNAFVTLNHVMGPNAAKLANKYVTSQIKKAPREYNSNFTSINENHDFYMEDGKAVLIFDTFEIAPGDKGIVTFAIDVSGIINLRLSPSETETKDAYSLKMAPLRTVSDTFGYSLTWYSGTQRVVIKKADWYTSLTINENRYYKGGTTLNTYSIALEAAPELLNNYTYLPISFYDEILGLFYFVDSQGYVTFSDFKDKL